MNVPVVLIEAFAWITSLAIYFQTPKLKYLQRFSWFLLLTVLVEISAKEVKHLFHSATIYYSVFTAFEFVFYLFTVRDIIQNHKAKKVITYLLYIYPLLAVFNIIFIQTKSFHTISYSVGSLLIVAAAIYYFFEIFQLPRAVNLLRDPAFWICTSLLFFYCCTFSLVGLWNQLHGLPKIILKNIVTILTLLNVLLYSLFSIAFLCRIKLSPKPAAQ